VNAGENKIEDGDVMSRVLDMMNVEDPQKRALMTTIIAPQFTDNAPSKSVKTQSKTRLKRLKNITEILASALGACSECWGGRKSCSQCRGKGKPGAFRPDPEAYAYFVAPVVRKMNPRRSKGQFSKMQHEGGQYGS